MQGSKSQKVQGEFRPYHRQFQVPLQTNHGEWRQREGIILRLTDSCGSVGWGEIAPIPWFGSESMAAAIAVCSQLPTEITSEQRRAIPNNFPACQFGWESAWNMLAQMDAEFTKFPMTRLSGLLPAGELALQSWKALWQMGYRTFKWKIGVGAVADELRIFRNLVAELAASSPPQSAKLRLDANGGLDYGQACQWLEGCDQLVSDQLVGDHLEIEFLEQPLPPEQFDRMVQLATMYSTPIALDESVATLAQLQDCYQRGWQGVFVIKPAIAGSPTQLRQFCQQHSIDAVFSSALETAIGRQASLQLAVELGNPQRAMGYGVNHWFTNPEIEDFEQLWQSL